MGLLYSGVIGCEMRSGVCVFLVFVEVLKCVL